MSEKKPNYKIWIIALIVVGVAGAFGWKFYQEKQNALPNGIASGNGRIEARLVDVASKVARFWETSSPLSCWR